MLLDATPLTHIDNIFDGPYGTGRQRDGDAVVVVASLTITWKRSEVFPQSKSK